MNYGTSVRQSKLREKREETRKNKTWTPAGFDISLADAISELDMSHDQIKYVGELTAKRQIANAKVGFNVYYRKATLERVLADAK